MFTWGEWIPDGFTAVLERDAAAMEEDPERYATMMIGACSGMMIDPLAATDLHFVGFAQAVGFLPVRDGLIAELGDTGGRFYGNPNFSYDVAADAWHATARRIPIEMVANVALMAGVCHLMAGNGYDALDALQVANSTHWVGVDAVKIRLFDTLRNAGLDAAREVLYGDAKFLAGKGAKW